MIEEKESCINAGYLGCSTNTISDQLLTAAFSQSFIIDSTINYSRHRNVEYEIGMEK
ncbi:MAG: hypothetical protein ABIW38_10285 [Ferruginibacter sp.]